MASPLCKKGFGPRVEASVTPFQPQSFRTLRDFTNRRPSSNEAHRLFHELIDDPNHRAAGIAGAAYLESSLEEALHFKLKKIGAESVDELFRGDAPLGTFSAKIRFAFSIGLFGTRARHDFDCIREIRNAFAHSKLKADFDTPEIQTTCWRVTFPRWGSGNGAITLTLYNEMLTEMATPGNHHYSKKILGS